MVQLLAHLQNEFRMELSHISHKNILSWRTCVKWKKNKNNKNGYTKSNQQVNRSTGHHGESLCIFKEIQISILIIRAAPLMFLTIAYYVGLNKHYLRISKTIRRKARILTVILFIYCASTNLVFECQRVM